MGLLAVNRVGVNVLYFNSCDNSDGAKLNMMDSRHGLSCWFILFVSFVVYQRFDLDVLSAL